jgi:hypothetical protein
MTDPQVLSALLQLIKPEVQGMYLRDWVTRKNSNILTKMGSSGPKSLYWFFNFEDESTISCLLCHFSEVNVKTYERNYIF